MELDFQTIYHLDIESIWGHRSWRWFEVRVAGLVANPNSLIHHRIQGKMETEEGPT